MAYNKAIFKEAMRQLSERRSRNQQVLEQHQQEIALTLPEIDHLNRELLSTNVKLTKIILGHTGNEKELIEQLRVHNLEAQQLMKELLIKHGYAADYLELQPTCKLCDDSGYQEGTLCSCVKSLIVQLSTEQLNASSPLALCEFGDFDVSVYSNDWDESLQIRPREHMEKILQYCKQYAETFTCNSPSLLFLGATGLGKTHLSLAIAKQVITKGYSVIYNTAQDVLRSVERNYFSREANEEEILQTLLEADLLILDDLGAEYPSQFNVSTLYNIVNSRLGKRKPTIISSNLLSKELETRYTDRIVSRLMTQYTYFRFVGSDVRQIRKNG